jgi:hypothetical protein
LTLMGFGLVASSFFELLRTGATYEHWSRFVVMSFFLSTALILLATRAIEYVLSLVEQRLQYWKAGPGKDAG